MTSKSSKKQVVILGAGYLGSLTAKYLDEANKSKSFEITLVSPREGFLLHKIGALRAAAKGEGVWVERALVPTNALFARNNTGTLVQGRAVSIDASAQVVHLADGKALPYDVLVIATGSTSNSPGEPPSHITSRQATQQYFKEFETAVAGSKSVVIVGAGPVGLELAGEIRETFGKEIAITCVSRTKEILQGGPVPLPAAGVKSMLDLVESLNIGLVLEDEVPNHYFPATTQTSAWTKPADGQVVLKSGRTLTCDLLISSSGVQVSTQFAPQEWLDADTKEVVIDPETFQVRGTANVFSAGDAAKTGFTKLAYIAMQDAPVLVKNVLQALDERAPTNRISARPKVAVMLVSMGTYQGRMLMPFATFGDFLSAQVKTKGMFSAKQWREMNVSRLYPQLPSSNGLSLGTAAAFILALGGVALAMLALQQ